MKKRLSRINKRLVILLLLILAAGAAGWFFFTRSSDSNSSEVPEPVQSTTDKDDGTLRLIASGDIIGHDSINANAETGGSYDYFKLMSEMRPFFEKSDIRFCNQATPAGGEAFGVSGYPVFNAPLELSRDMVRLGCNLINLGTNHTYDKGQNVINASLKEWDKQNVLAHAGANRSTAERDTVKYFEVEGIKFAFASYSTYTNSPITNGFGVTMYSADLAAKQISDARQKADIVIVSMRWGTEYSESVNFEQERLAKQLADRGADIILGHGPHVLQPVKKVKAADGREALVWFSLGNFLNSQIDTPSLISGLAVMDIDKISKKVDEISFLPIYQHYEWTAAQKKSEELLARKNFRLVALDTAAELLSRSQNNTTVGGQTARVKDLLNTYTSVPIISSDEY